MKYSRWFSRIAPLFLGVLAAFVFLLLPRSSFAAVRTWDGGGVDTNWNTCANWSSDACPGAADVATFDATSTKNAVMNATINVSGIDINTGYTGTISQATGIGVTVGAGNYDQADGIFTGSNAAMTINGSFTLSSGTFNATTGTTTVTGAWTHTAGGTFNHTNGTVAFTGNSTLLDVAVTEEFFALTLNKSGGTTLTFPVADTLIVHGALTMTGGNFATGTLEARGNISVSALGFTTTAPLKINGTTDQTFAVGTAPFSSIIVDKTSGSLNFSSSVNAGTSVGTFTLTSGTVNTQNFSFTVFNYAQTGGTLNGGSSTLVFGGTFVQSGGNFNAGSGTGTYSGAFTLSGGTYNASTGTASFSSTGAWTHTAGGTFNHNSGTMAFTSGSSTIDVASTETFGNLTVNKSAGSIWTVSSGDTLVAMGALAFTQGNFATGTIEARGNISAVTSWTNTGVLKINGTVDQTFAASATPFSSIVVDKASGSLNIPSTFSVGTATGTFTLANGTINTQNFAFTVANFAQTGGTFNAGSSTLVFGGAFTQSGGTFNGATGTVTHTGAFTLSAGTYSASTGTTAVASNWTHTAGGTFAHNNGTVSFASANGGGTINVAGTQDSYVGTAEEFYNLTVSKGNGNYLVITAGDTLIVLGTLRLTDGGVTTGTLDVRGNIVTTTGWATSAPVKITGTADQSITTSVTDKLQGGVTIDKPSGTVSLATAYNSTSGTFTLVSGTLNTQNYSFTPSVFTQTGGTFNGGSSTVAHTGVFTLSGGTYNATTGIMTVSSTWTHTAGGVFNHSNGTVTFAGNNSLGIDVIDTETFGNVILNKPNGNALAITSGDTLVTTGTLTFTDGAWSTGTFEAQGNVVAASSWQAGGTGLLKFAGSAVQTFTLTTITDPNNGDITVNKTGGQVNLVGNMVLNASGQDFIIQEGTFDLNGYNLTVNGTSGTLVVQDGGNLQLQGGETLTANASNPQLLSGSTVTYDGVSASYTLKDYTYHHLVIAGGASSVFAPAANESLGGNLTIASSILDQATRTLTVTGTFSNNGTLRRRQNEAFTATMDTDSGTVEYVGDGDGSAEAVTIADFGGTDYYNLVINDANATKDTFSIASGLTIGGTLTTSSGEFSLGVQPFTAAGLVVNGGNFSGGSSVMSVSGPVTYSGGGLTSTSSTFSIGGDFTHTSGVFSSAGGTVIFTGNSATIDVPTSESFAALTVSKANGQVLTIAAGDTLVVSGALNYADGAVNGGTISAQGAVAVGSGFDGGTASLTFSGGSEQVFNLAGATDTFNGDIAVSKSGGMVALASALVMDAVGQDFTVTLGGFSTSMNNHALTVVGNVAVNGGVLNFGASTVDLNGNLAIAGGTLNMNTATITAAGNISLTSGSMAQDTSTVTLDGTDQALTGNLNFYNLTKLATSAPLTLTFSAGDTVTVSGTLTLQGASVENSLALRSSSAGVQSNLAPTGAVTTMRYLDVKDNSASPSASCLLSCVNSGNTTGWTFARGGGGGYVAPITAAITLISPNGGEVVTAGDTMLIEWTSRATNLVNIRYSIDGGASWSTIVTGASNTDLYQWTVADVATDDALVRVESTDLTSVVAYDISDAAFTIIQNDTDEEVIDEDLDEQDQEAITEVRARVDALPEDVPLHGLVKLADDGNASTFADSAVFYVGADGRRHAFPNEFVFKTWFCDFSQVRIITSADLASMEMGENVTYRPGTRMVKFQSSPKVYAVDRFGTLRWVATENVARSLYGLNWNTMIDDVSDAFFGNYEFGSAISSLADFDPDAAEREVRYPSDSIDIPGYTPDAGDPLVCSI